jgi:serine/threonine protein kinase
MSLLPGRAPFQGNSALAILRCITQQPPAPLRQLRADAPEDVDRIVSRALEKDAAIRYQTASEMARDLSAALAKLSAPLPPPASRELRVSRTYAVAATLLVVFLAGAAVWLYQRSEKRHWAREEAIPAISKLESEDKSLAAFLLLREAEHDGLPATRDIPGGAPSSKSKGKFISLSVMGAATYSPTPSLVSFHRKYPDGIRVFFSGVVPRRNQGLSGDR